MTVKTPPKKTPPKKTPPKKTPPKPKEFKNTFAPNIKNEYLTASDVLAAVMINRLQFEDLPPDVAKAVTAESKNPRMGTGSIQFK